MTKRVISIIIGLFTTAALALGQSPGASDSVRAVQQKVQTEKHGQQKQSPSVEEEMQKMKLKGFIDEDGGGIDDRIQRMQGKQHGQMMQNRMHDQFIDLDGDGINDDRCSGMCISQSKGKKGRGMHK